MPKSLGRSLPEPLRKLLDGSDLAGRVGLTWLLVTVAEDGWPHVAMLSVGEVLAAGPESLRLALWPGSRTTANLERTGFGLLMAVVGSTTYHVRLQSRRGADLSVRRRPRAYFAASVVEVLEDVVGYATVTNGIGFRLNQPEEVLADWEAAVAGLRRAAVDPDG